MSLELNPTEIRSHVADNAIKITIFFVENIMQLDRSSITFVKINIL